MLIFADHRDYRLSGFNIDLCKAGKGRPQCIVITPRSVDPQHSVPRGAASGVRDLDMVAVEPLLVKRRV